MTRVCNKCGIEKPIEDFSVAIKETGFRHLTCKPCRNEERKLSHRNDPRRRLLSHAKARAKSKGVPFDLTVDDIVVPEVCPVLGIPIFVGDGLLTNNSPTIDRFIPSEGYTKENVAVISWRANRIKADATPEELRMVSQWMDYNA